MLERCRSLLRGAVLTKRGRQQIVVTFGAFQYQGAHDKGAREAESTVRCNRGNGGDRMRGRLVG
ncbi:MAG: hypothetical protein RLZZ450_316 [Pseudomonadota bacterium]|jgi:hypothetical protein